MKGKRKEVKKRRNGKEGRKKNKGKNYDKIGYLKGQFTHQTYGLNR